MDSSSCPDLETFHFSETSKNKNGVELKSIREQVTNSRYHEIRSNLATRDNIKSSRDRDGHHLSISYQKKRS